MTGELVRRENGDTGRRMTCEDTETGRRPCEKQRQRWSYEATSEGMPQASRTGAASEGMWPCKHLEFGLRASRTVRE